MERERESKTERDRRLQVEREREGGEKRHREGERDQVMGKRAESWGESGRGVERKKPGEARWIKRVEQHSAFHAARFLQSQGTVT